MVQPSPQLIAALAGATAIVLVMQSTSQALATGIMAVLTVLLLYRFPGLAALAAAAFLAGALADGALYLASVHLWTDPDSARARMLEQYYDRSGLWLAMLFAGFLTVWMTLPAVLLWREAGAPLWALPVIGFVCGALPGVFVQGSPAMANLLPFYSATTGDLENRAWDGASIALVCVLAAPLARAT
jgi:hypothetical protein